MSFFGKIYVSVCNSLIDIHIMCIKKNTFILKKNKKNSTISELVIIIDLVSNINYRLKTSERRESDENLG